MAKTMAVLKNGTVTNMIWCRDGEPETDALKSLGGRPVGIGDTYAEGKWYRNGVEILTPLEQAQAEAAALREQLADMTEALTILEVTPDEEVE